MTVVIADTSSAPSEVVHPAAIAPFDASKGDTVEVAPLSEGEDFHWQPEKSPEGPMSILISGADHRAFVYRNGIEIGRVRLTIDDPLFCLIEIAVAFLMDIMTIQTARSSKDQGVITLDRVSQAVRHLAALVRRLVKKLSG